MSGGQQQRVALARALAIEPSVLLLDEPLSALDAKVRTSLREEIRRLQLELGTTTIFVTHDQEEAMAISDRVAVMSKGRIEQIDAPDVLYNSPASAFVASFVGQMNRIPALIDGVDVVIFGSRFKPSVLGQASGAVSALVRPESIRILPASAKAATAFAARVVTRSFLGPVSQVTLRAESGELINALMPSSESGHLHSGAEVAFEISDSKILIEAAHVG
jgi:putative spermidine/putrescine transport system ATP-binding protein